MINHIKIQNFKSIKHLELNCKRVNIFIGKPNSGKSNILESIGIFALWDFTSLRNLIRFSKFSELFYELDVKQKIEISLDTIRLEFQYPQQGKFIFPSGISEFFVYDEGGLSSKSGLKHEALGLIKPYRFDQLPSFVDTPTDVLQPTQGQNLPGVLYSHRELRNLIGELMADFELEVVVRATEKAIDVQKKADGISIAYPLSSISETLRRLIFHIAAIKTNENAALIFEEPEAHAFPYYTKYLSELIVNDQSNQYFISTHNPYFLISLIEKTHKNDLAINLVSMRDGQTQLKQLNQNEIEEMLDQGMSLFFNIDSFVNE